MNKMKKSTKKQKPSKEQIKNKMNNTMSVLKKTTEFPQQIKQAKESIIGLKHHLK